MNKTIYLYSFLVILLLLIFIILKLSKDYFENKNITNDEIIITISTSPKRLDNIKETLDSMLNQTIKPTKIFINVPHVFKRSNETYDNNKLENIQKLDSKIQINRCEDKGPITKVLETLKLITNPDSIIIIMDDDINYNNDVIEKLISELQNNPETVIAGNVFEHENINIVEGYKSICFKRKIFKDDFYEFVNKSISYIHCYKSDDFIISHYLNKNNIKSIQTDINIKILDYGLQEDALQKQDNINHRERYSKCNKYINNNFTE